MTQTMPAVHQLELSLLDQLPTCAGLLTPQPCLRCFRVLLRRFRSSPPRIACLGSSLSLPSGFFPFDPPISVTRLDSLKTGTAFALIYAASQHAHQFLQPS